jgi:5-methylcytosine-specific restriction endonuclease McrA
VRKLDPPTEDPIEVYDSCVAAVRDPTLQQTYILDKPQIAQAVARFDDATSTTSWVSLPRVPRGNSSALISTGLTKKHLTDLYETHMVGSAGRSRQIYDDILVAGGDLCPFCGGRGHVHTLDHFLPKANFPLYSVLPANLVPCCRDCNTGKNSSIGTQISEQTLHPYLDNDKYFEQRWVHADVCKTNPIVLKFKCSPPSEWTGVEKLRVQRHFLIYRLSSRFGVQAGAELARLVDLRINSLRILSPEDFKAYLVDSANSSGFDLNGWSRTMYAALARTGWFWTADFACPDWHMIESAH